MKRGGSRTKQKKGSEADIKRKRKKAKAGEAEMKRRKGVEQRSSEIENV